MEITIISIFPEIFESFLNTSLIQKAQENWIITFNLINPRDFCEDKHQKIDDEIYGGWKWMLLKAQPLISAIEWVIKTKKLEHSDFSILFPSPSRELFNQKISYGLSKKEHLIFLCGRYEGIDARVETYIQQKYPQHRRKISLGQFIVLGGELPSMVMIEAITRLIPWVIKEKQSRIHESYALQEGMNNLEAPNYTRPEEIYGLHVPETLLSWDSALIEQRRNENSQQL